MRKTCSCSFPRSFVRWRNQKISFAELDLIRQVVRAEIVAYTTEQSQAESGLWMKSFDIRTPTHPTARKRQIYRRASTFAFLELIGK